MVFELAAKVTFVMLPPEAFALIVTLPPTLIVELVDGLVMFTTTGVGVGEGTGVGVGIGVGVGEGVGIGVGIGLGPVSELALPACAAGQKRRRHHW